MSIRILIRDHPRRALALETDTHVLIFRQNSVATDGKNGAQPALGDFAEPQSIVEFVEKSQTDLEEYRPLSLATVQGTLGLITINNDVFLCVVTGASRVATVRPRETVQRISAVEFRKLVTKSFLVLY